MKRGFTLIELVVAVAVAAILAAVALPSFTQALQRSRRVEAVSALMQVQLAQERWRSSHAAYATDLRLLGVEAATRHYRLAILDGAAHRYTATATAVGAQAGDSACATFGFTLSGGTQSLHASGSANAEQCWRR